MRKRALLLGLTAASVGACVLAALVFVRCSPVKNDLDRLERAADESEYPECGGEPMSQPPAPELFGTPAEICARGDDPNPGAMYSGVYPSDEETQERDVGEPARFSGYTTWIDSVRLVDASTYVDGYPGKYLRIEVRVFNRDAEVQRLDATDFAAWRESEGFRSSDFVGAADELHSVAEMASGAMASGSVYLYVGEPRGDVFVRFDPDVEAFNANESTGVWRVLDDGRPVIPGAVPAS